MNNKAAAAVFVRHVGQRWLILYMTQVNTKPNIWFMMLDQLLTITVQKLGIVKAMIK